VFGVRGDKRIKELKEMAKAFAMFETETFDEEDNPYADYYTHVFLIEYVEGVFSIVVAQQTYSFVDNTETYGEIWISPKDFDKITEWIKEKLGKA
jgi:hypothetical protein